jgi:hypothetical protein
MRATRPLSSQCAPYNNDHTLLKSTPEHLVTVKAMPLAAVGKEHIAYGGKRNL